VQNAGDLDTKMGLESKLCGTERGEKNERREATLIKKRNEPCLFEEDSKQKLKAGLSMHLGCTENLSPNNGSSERKVQVRALMGCKRGIITLEFWHWTPSAKRGQREEEKVKRPKSDEKSETD